ncbi:helix-turn-helix transcriptional regulator, partial [Streptomyces hainanensis]
YRVSRFVSVTPTEERFARDESFDLPTFWTAQAAAFARSLLRAEVRLRLTPAGARALPRVTDREAATEALATASPPDAAGWITTTLAVESEEVAYSQLLSLGPETVVLTPPSLRDALAAAARRMVTHYDS